MGGNPEWEIVYINTIIPNATTPDYDDLAIIGMNIRASRVQTWGSSAFM